MQCVVCHVPSKLDATIHIHQNRLKQVGADATHALAVHTWCGPIVLGLIFLKIEDT